MAETKQLNSKHIVYQITVSNFRKYNSNLKKGHKATLISNNFCTDPELGTLPITTRWMFLGIVLTCGDFGGSTVRMSSKDLRNLLECNRNIDRDLESLQELQVLTYEKFDLLNNRKEYKEKRKENNRIEVTDNFSGKKLGIEQPSQTERPLLQVAAEMAEIFFMARRLHSTNDAAFADFMGPDHMAILKSLGGKKFLLGMTENSFEVRRLRDMILLILKVQNNIAVGAV